MDLLYRVGGRLSGTEIGKMMEVDYSTVSVGRNRLREKLKSDKHLSQIIKRVEADLSTIKICPLLTPEPSYQPVLFSHILYSRSDPKRSQEISRPFASPRLLVGLWKTG